MVYNSKVFVYPSSIKRTLTLSKYTQQTEERMAHPKEYIYSCSELIDKLIGAFLFFCPTLHLANATLRARQTKFGMILWINSIFIFNLRFSTFKT